MLDAVHRAAFDEEDLRDVPVRLIPVVQYTRSLRGELDAAAARCALLEAALDLLTEAVLIVDAERGITIANAAARHALARGRFRSDVGRLLPIAETCDVAHFERLVDVLDGFARETEPFEGRHGGGPHIARILRFPRSSAAYLIALRPSPNPQGSAQSSP